MKITASGVMLLVLSFACVFGSGASFADGAAPELGRLFYSPERRLQMEQQRQVNAMRVRTIEGETLRLDGVVRRSGHAQTIWINGQPHSAGDAEQIGITQPPDPARSGSARIRGTDSPGDELRVGESINRATGVRDDRIGGGSIRTPGAAR